MRKELLAPLAVLALGLAAAAGFFAASVVLSEGDGRETIGSRVVVQAPEENDTLAPPAVIRRAYAGLVLEERSGDDGVRIRRVVPGGPAADAGLEAGDIVTAIDGKAVDSVDDVRAALEDKSPGDEVTFTVRWDGQEEDVAVTLGARPSPGEPVPPTGVRPELMMRPYLGVELADITPELRRELDLAQDSGVVILEVDRDGPAYEAGLRRGDVIMQIGSQWVETAQETVLAILDHEPGDEVSLLIRRDTQELRVEVELGARPRLGLLPQMPSEGTEVWSWWRLGPLADLLPDLDLDRLNLEALFGRLVRTDIVLLDEDGQRVELHLAAGTLTSVSETEVRLAPNGGGAELRYAVTEKTRVLRNLLDRGVTDLRPGDRALVLTRGASDEALLIVSPRFALEGGLSAVPVPGMPHLILPFGGLY